MKTIVRIVALFVLCFGLLFSAGSAALAQSTGDDVTTPVSGTTDEASSAEASPVAPIETPATEEATSTPDDGEFNPATIGEEPGGDFHEEIDGTIRLTSDVNSGNGYALLDLPVPANATFADIQSLGADIMFEADDTCGGGSPRFVIELATGGAVSVYIGDPPNFTGCTGTVSTGELIGSSDLRFDTSQVGGSFYSTYADALALVGNAGVSSLQLIVDGGWAAADGEQTVYVQSITGVTSAFEGVSNLRVIKTEDTTAGPVVPGACFTIFAYGEGGTRGDIVADQQCDDDLDGNVDFVGLPALTALIIAETVAPDGYAAGPDFPVTLAEGDNFIGFPNSLLPPTSNLRVIKTKDTTAGPVVPGACFTIFAYGEGGVRGDVIAAQQCDDDLDGNVDFVGLPALTALIVAETVAPDGYVAGPDFPVTLAEGDNAIGFPNSLAPVPSETVTATATATATATSPAGPTSTTTPSNPAPTGTTTVTTLPSTGTGTGSSSSLSLGLIAALLTLVVISGGFLITKRRNA